MNEDRPVPNATARYKVTIWLRRDRPCSSSSTLPTIGGVGARSVMASNMITMLRAAPTINAPGNPTEGTRAKPLSMAPKAAPNELVKYRTARTRPGFCFSRRRIPTLISGKVIPSKMQAGRMSPPAMPHLAKPTAVPPPSAGKIES